LARLVFIADKLHGLLRRADELDLALATYLGEMRILREKAIAGVNRLDIGDLGGTDDACDVEIALRRRPGADADSLVRQAQIGGIPVGLAKDGDDLNAEVLAGPNHAQGDFTAIGHENARSEERRVGKECRCVWS